VFSEGYKRYVLGVLTLVYTLNCLDRSLIGLLLEPIKRDLDLSDTQLGFLTGIAFALFYSTMGVPIARWADRGNRVTITSITIGLWGVTVMSCLFVTNFVQLVCARIAAAIGEAGSMPPTYSLVGDYFPGMAERARAMAVYMLASPFSVLAGYALGGWINELYGWRMALFVVGVPGLIVAAIVHWTVREPRVQRTVPEQAARSAPTILDVLNIFWQRRALRHLNIAIILLWMIAHGMNPWYAAFMMRSHGMGTAELGVWLGVIISLGGLLGIALSGFVIPRWFAGNDRGQMRLSAVVVALLVPFSVLFLLLPDKYWAMAALVPTTAAFNFFLGPTFALMQRLVIDETRATAMAVMMLLANLIGMGIGPQLVGILSDLLAPVVGGDSLRHAMLAVSLVSLWAAYHFWQIGKTVSSDIADVAQVRS